MEETSPESTTEAPKIVQKNVGMAVVAYLLFFVPLLTDAKNDPFVKYHVKQGLVLFILGSLVWVASVMPLLMMLAWVFHIGMVVFAIIGIMNAIAGKEEPLPLIGHFAEHFHF